MINVFTIFLLIMSIVLSVITTCCIIIMMVQNKTKKQNFLSAIEKSSELVHHSEETLDKCDFLNEQQSLNDKWIEGMKKKYGYQWNTFFDNVAFPLDEKGREEMSLMMWNIASLTIDLIKSRENGAPSRYKDSVAVVAGEKKHNEVKDKLFFRDPTTVPKRVIAVRDWLRWNGVDEAEVSVFGYKVKVSKNDDD